MSKTYKEKLRDPKWQRKKNRVLDRDDYACLLCGDKETTLHVHHCYYQFGLEPWDYPDASLLTLCETCHHDETIAGKDGRDNLIRSLQECGITGLDMSNLAHHLRIFSPCVQRKQILEALHKAIRSLEPTDPICPSPNTDDA